MIAPPIPVGEARRQATLRSTQLLDSAPEERFDRITRIARRLFGVPIALVSLVDADRQWFKSKQGLEVAETSREISFCAHAILADEPLIVENAQEDARFFDNPLVTEAPGIRFYAGHPLVAADGSRLGTLCIISNEPRKLSAEDKVMLHTLATMVECELGALDSATTDTMTGLANLRGFLEMGDYVLRIAKRLKHPLQLLLVHVKAPDLPGSAKDVAADARSMLKEVAADLLRSHVESDLIARIGPREFALLRCKSAEEPVWKDSHEAAFLRRLKTCVVGHAVAYDPMRHASLEDVVSETESLLKEKRLTAAAP